MRRSKLWYLFLSLAATSSLTRAGARNHHAFVVDNGIRRPFLGWTIPAITKLRGGSDEQVESSSEYEEEWEEEEATTIDPGEDGQDDADSDDSEDLDMFLDAQEFIDDDDDDEEAETVVGGGEEDIVNEETTISVEDALGDGADESLLDHEADEEFEEEEQEEIMEEEEEQDEEMIEEVVDDVLEDTLDGSGESLQESRDEEEAFEAVVEEDTTPETDFEKTLSQEEDTPSTEDASQVEESEFATEDVVVVEETNAELTQIETGDRTPEFVEEQPVQEEESEIANDATVSMVETETTEQDTTFAAASQAAANIIPSEVDFSQQHTTDDDSMTFVDRMELADDEAENVLTEFPEEEINEESVMEDAVVVEDDASPPPILTTTSVVTDDGVDAAVQDTTAIESVAVLTDEMKRILIKELKFHRREVNGMKPEIAVVLAEKRLRRPCEGIPSNWYTDKAKHLKAISHERQKNTVLKIVLFPIAYAVPIALTALAIYGSADLAQLFSTLSSEDVITATSATPKAPTDTGYQEIESTSASFDAGGGGGGGIAPGDHSRIPKKEDEDESWIDKIITGIAKPIKAFWDIKL